MMKTPIWATLFKAITILGISLLFVTCKNGTNKQNSTENESETSPTSHTQNQPEEYSKLSEDDRIKLANARGLTAQSLSFEALQTKIAQSDHILHAYAFWQLGQPESMNLIKNLRKMKDEVGEQNLKLILINLDSKYKQVQLNTFIRENGVTSEVFMVEEDTNAQSTKIHPDWDDSIPAVLFINKTNGTNLFYHQTLIFEELMAIVQPLLL